MPTKAEIRREVADRLGRLLSFEATGGTTTEIHTSDPQVRAGALSTEQYGGWWARPVDGDAAGETRMVTVELTSGVTGRLAVPPTTPFSNDISDGDTIELYGLPPYDIDAAINRALRKMSAPTRFPLTLCPDGDMEAIDVAKWTAGANATVSKVSGTEQVSSGQRGLRVVRSTGTAGVTVDSEPWRLIDTVAYTTWVSVRGLTPGLEATLELVVDDEVEVTEVWDSGPDGLISAVFQAPVGGAEAFVRLGLGAGAADDEAVFDDVVVIEEGRLRWDVPDYIEHPPSQIAHVQRFQAPFALNTSWRQGAQLVKGWTVLTDVWAATPYQIHVPSTGAPGPVWVTAVRNFDELTTDDAETPASLEWCVLGVLRQIYQQLRDKAGTGDARIWDGRFREASLRYIRESRRYVPKRASKGRPAIPFTG